MAAEIVGLTLDPESPAKLFKSPIAGVINGRPMFASVDIYLDGNDVICDAGSLLWMDSGVEMDTSIVGGCCDGCWRSLSGEACCMNTYTGKGKVGLGFTLPGDMVCFRVEQDKGWMISEGAFVCGSSNLKISAKWAGCCAGAADEGTFLTTVKIDDDSKVGAFYAGGYGGINQHSIPAGQTLIIDNGMFFASSDKLRLQVAWFGSGSNGSCTAMFFSGEGLGMIFQGPAVIYTQNRDPSIFKPPVDNSQQNGGN